MQRVRADGTPVWKQDGIRLCMAGGHQNKPSIVIVKSIINWALSNSLNTYNRHSDWKPKLTVLRRTRPDATCIMLQRCPLIYGLHYKIENGQFFVVWLDYREDFGEESRDAIYGQLIDLAGKSLWEKDGVAISTSQGEHYPPFVVSVGQGQGDLVLNKLSDYLNF